MKNGIKVGFGLAVGFVLATAASKALYHAIMRWGVNDEAFMEFEKTHNPTMYEELKKYQ